MQKLTPRRRMALFMSLALILAFGMTTLSIAQQKTKIAGKLTMAYTEQDMIEVGDTEGHTLTLAQAEGVNGSVGEHKFMDGAQVVTISFGDLTKGNGPHQGYIKFVKGGDTTFAKWEGQVTTKLSSEGTPVAAFEGTFSYIKGTGSFENIQGDGTYKGRFISKTIYTVEWEGEYVTKK